MTQKETLDSVCRGDCGKCPFTADCDADVRSEWENESAEVRDERHS